MIRICAPSKCKRCVCSMRLRIFPSFLCVCVLLQSMFLIYYYLLYTYCNEILIHTGMFCVDEVKKTECVRILRSQSAAARVLFEFWQQTEKYLGIVFDNFSDLLRYLASVNDVSEIRSSEITRCLAALKEAIQHHKHTSDEAARDLDLLFFAKDHGEALYKKVREKQAQSELGLGKVDSDENYRQVKLAASQEVRQDAAQAEKAKKEKASASKAAAATRGGRGGGRGGYNHHGRGRGRGWNNSYFQNYPMPFPNGGGQFQAPSQQNNNFNPQQWNPNPFFKR